MTHERIFIYNAIRVKYEKMFIHSYYYLGGFFMKKTFRLEGLDCANCAMKIENAVKKIEGVDEASVNFMTTKLSIRADRENMPEILKETEKTVKQLEPDVDMVKA